ncbi:MAG TPA: DUF1003 domain-containing protein [Candidatus Dormibacteraeota bacterium]|nr:DUF1003 domain-containing protein [Candidatus Dormibacteraeota bacterium]
MSDTDTSHVSIKERLHLRKRQADDHAHPVNVVHHDEATRGERIADAAAAGIGSWRFLIIQTVAVSIWVTFNIVALVNHWDPFPFILLNLLFSVQAAYTGPVLLLAGNRQSQKDRLTLEHAAHEADKADQQNMDILAAIQKNTELTEGNTELTLQILQHLQAQVTAHIAADAAAATQKREETGQP